MVAEEELSVGHMLVLEYKHLKQEQLARISTRDNLVYVTLASLAAVAAATIQVEMMVLLLLLPPACLILGWTYLVNDQKVSAIGKHLRVAIIPALADLLETDSPLFTWEFEHRRDSRRRLRKIGQLIIDLITFCVPALAAMVVFALVIAPSALFITIIAFELAGTLALGWAIIDHAEISADPPFENRAALRQRDAARHIPNL